MTFDEAMTRLFASRNRPGTSPPARPTANEMLADALDEYGRRRSGGATFTPPIGSATLRSGEGPAAEDSEYSRTAPNAAILNNPAVLAAESQAWATSNASDPDLSKRTEQGFQAWRLPDQTVQIVWGHPTTGKDGFNSAFIPPTIDDFPGKEVPAGAELLLDYHTHPFDNTGKPVEGVQGQQRIVGSQQPSQTDINGVWTDSRSQIANQGKVIGVVRGRDGLYYYGPNVPNTVWREPTVSPTVVSVPLTGPLPPVKPFAPQLTFMPNGGDSSQ